MNWLGKRPGFQRSPHGLEWLLWKRLPAVLGWGTVLPLAVAALVWWLAPPQTALAAVDADRLPLIFQLAGLVVLHWTLVLTVAIGCCIVMLMKGPAYVADPYPPPGRDGQA
jgi:hypothetical protein